MCIPGKVEGKIAIYAGLINKRKLKKVFDNKQEFGKHRMYGFPESKKKKTHTHIQNSGAEILRIIKSRKKCFKQIILFLVKFYIYNVVFDFFGGAPELLGRKRVKDGLFHYYTTENVKFS